MNIKNLSSFFIVLLLAITFPSMANEEPVMPDQVVESVTQSLLDEISDYRTSLQQAESEAHKKAMLDEFFSELTNTLEPVVDFNWISLNVMGSYRKQASVEQRKKFREVFKRGLVETYGRGLLNYNKQKIVVFPLEEELGDRRKVTVKQEIQAEDASYPLFYSMGLNREGDWKVINVIINGINLGATFRNQFQQAAVKYDGDISKVIENWTVEETN